MNQKQRKAKLKKTNYHRSIAKTPEYQARWEVRHDKWLQDLKEQGRLIDAMHEDLFPTKEVKHLSLATWIIGLGLGLIITFCLVRVLQLILT